jgi:hypothetical protein
MLKARAECPNIDQRGPYPKRKCTEYTQLHHGVDQSGLLPVDVTIAPAMESHSSRWTFAVQYNVGVRSWLLGSVQE